MNKKSPWIVAAVCVGQLAFSSARADIVPEPPPQQRGTVRPRDPQPTPAEKKPAKKPKKKPEPKPQPPGTKPKPDDKVGMMVEPEVEPVGERTAPKGDRVAPDDMPDTTRGTTNVRGEAPAHTRGREVAPEEGAGTRRQTPEKKKKPAPTYGDPPAK